MKPEPRILPVQNIVQMEAQYHIRVTTVGQTVDLAKWLPAFAHGEGGRPLVRPIRAGEVVIILADTGAGKTVVLQSILASQKPEPCMLFEMELPSDLCFERFAAAANDVDTYRLEQDYIAGEGQARYKLDDLHHIFTVAEPRVTLADVEATVNAAKAGKIPGMDKPPVCVALDYLGLIHGDKQGSRYEFTTEVANNLKPLAKALDVVLLVSCQVHRKKEDSSVEVTLHSARDSGQIEASGDLLLGVWRTVEDRGKMVIKVLKGRKDGDGQTVEARFDGPRMRITPVQEQYGEP